MINGSKFKKQNKNNIFKTRENYLLYGFVEVTDTVNYMKKPSFIFFNPIQSFFLLKCCACLRHVSSCTCFHRTKSSNKSTSSPPKQNLLLRNCNMLCDHVIINWISIPPNQFKKNKKIKSKSYLYRGLREKSDVNLVERRGGGGDRWIRIWRRRRMPGGAMRQRQRSWEEPLPSRANTEFG